MKRLFLTFTVAMLLYGCSNKDTERSTESKTVKTEQTDEEYVNKSGTLEDRINSIMEEKGYSNSEDIFHYEIKGDYIFVLTKNIRKPVEITILKDDSNELKWVFTYETGEATLISPTENEGPYIMAIQPKDKNVKDVKAFGKPTKQIKITKDYSGVLTEEVNCWIFIADDIGKSPASYEITEDIEYIDK
ncbi:hypothetical protein M3152_13445 [Sporosarcina luteola]|uniref:hypothetical protein n=1 Tax=Bacillales TaxID=1385 RepID=UPI00203FDEEA|nr:MULTISPECIES: hypothetical protein [Bacillales]MCM3638705.1 hypothetical protein [Sporosarcina luteola]